MSNLPADPAYRPLIGLMRRIERDDDLSQRPRQVAKRAIFGKPVLSRVKGETRPRSHDHPAGSRIGEPVGTEIECVRVTTPGFGAQGPAAPPCGGLCSL